MEKDSEDIKIMSFQEEKEQYTWLLAYLKFYISKTQYKIQKKN